MTNMQRDLRNIWDSKSHSPSKPIDYVQEVEADEGPKKLEYVPDQLDVLRKFGVFEDSKNIIEDNFERFKYITEPHHHHDGGRSYHYSPPSYHPPPPPEYHPPAPSYHPPPYKAVYEVPSTDTKQWNSLIIIKYIRSTSLLYSCHCCQSSWSLEHS